jgi:murein DD-endopeptidase MepM/ murein hydrolase activator NlpD
MLPALFAAFCLGFLVGWWLRDKGPPLPALVQAPPLSANERADAPRPPEAPTATAGAASSAAAASSAIDALRDRRLRVPIDGAKAELWKGAFEERRDGRAHEAVDILAPRNTPIRAVDDGEVAKLFDSKAGGHTIYQFDPTGRFCYYYAHLERYADGLADGKHVSRGDVIGYVGTSGNAPPGTPHLHFTIFELTDARRWWQGRAIDPYLVFRR